MSARHLFSHIIVLVTLCFSIWGPKIYGYIDLMVLVPASLLAVWMAANCLVVPRKFYITSISLGLIILAWVSISIILNGMLDLQGVFRSIRAFVSTLILVPLFYIFGSRVISASSGFVLLVTALFLNNLLIYLQIFFPSLQEFMSSLWGFDKSLRDVRAFGLTAGYDSAGYLAAFLASSAFLVSLVFHSWKWFVFFVFCAGAVGFTSRTSMLFLAIFIVIVILFGKWKKRGNLARVNLTVIGMFFSFSWYVLPVIFSGVSELTVLSGSVYYSHSENYAATSLSEVIHQMAVTPQDSWTWLIGRGEIVPWSDIGYVKILHLGGVPLLGMVLGFYIYVYCVATSYFKSAMVCDEEKNLEPRWIYVWSAVSGLMLLVIFVGNFKNLYFFTRGYHEIFVIICSFLLGACDIHSTRRQN